MMVCTASGARQGGMHTSRATYSAVFPRWRRPWGDRPYVAQVWPGPPSRSALRVWPCHWCGATAPERRELFPRSARCPITACSAFGVRVPLMACHRANESEVKPSLLCGSWASPLCPAPLAPRAPLDFFLNLCLPPWGVSDKFPRSRPVLRLGRPKTNVERPVLRSGRRKINVERPVLRLWYPRMTRFTFGVPQDKRRTPRSTFGAPQERESRLHRFRPESPQQTLGSQGAPPRSVGQDVRTVFWQLLLSPLRKD